MTATSMTSTTSMLFHVVPCTSTKGGVLANARTMNPMPRQQIPADRFFRELERMDERKQRKDSDVIDFRQARERLRPQEPRHER